MDYAVDSHFHIWDLNNFSYPWPTANEAEIYRNVSAKEYCENISQTPVQYGVFVQCLNKKPEEAKWVLEQTKHNSFIKGVVAGLNFTDHEVLQNDLENLAKYEEFVGCRHILDFEQFEWITRDDVIRGIEIVGQNGYTFDLLLRPPHLKYIPKLLSSLPSEQKLVIDHIAKPYIKDKKMETWKIEIAEIAKYQNVYCKISGLVTEADLDKWSTEDLKPYANHIIDVFGTNRVMFGSDWPVCTLAKAYYKTVYSTAKSLVSHLSDTEKQAFFKDNAVKFYNLNL